MSVEEATGTARPNIVMVTGAYPPNVCGVGDYTHRLMQATPSNWELFEASNWSLYAVPGILRRLFARQPDGVVIQYPTQGYGWSLVPHLLVLIGRLTGRYRTVLALHEFSSLSKKARAVLSVVSHAADHVIFTTEVERDRARQDPLFDLRVPTSVIGILSNIPEDPDPRPFHQRNFDFAYFGHIRSNKGLDEFLKVMTGVRTAAPYSRIAVIGEVPVGYEMFGDMVARRCGEIGIDLILGLDDVAVGRLLADVRILYLPFPDGVSARRGSVLAGFGSGAIIATRIGPATPPTLESAVISCTGLASDVAILCRAMQMSSEAVERYQIAGRDYVRNTLPRSWTDVAMRYDAAIAEALAKSRGLVGLSEKSPD